MSNASKHIAVSSYLKNNKIDINEKKFRSFLLENTTSYTVSKSYRFESNELENLLYSNFTPSCKLSSNIVDKGSFIYLLKIYKNGKFTGLCKIGISKNVEKRILDLNTSWESVGYVFVLHKKTDKPTPLALKIEKSIFTILTHKDLMYSTGYDFSGYTEICTYKSWFDELI